MSEQKGTMKEFIKTHKKEIAVCTGLTIAGTIGIVLGVKHYKADWDKHRAMGEEIIKAFQEVIDRRTDLPIPEIDYGEVAHHWIEDANRKVMIANMPLDKMGEFGAYLGDTCGWGSNETVGLVIEELTKVTE